MYKLAQPTVFTETRKLAERLDTTATDVLLAAERLKVKQYHMATLHNIMARTSKHFSQNGVMCVISDNGANWEASSLPNTVLRAPKNPAAKEYRSDIAVRKSVLGPLDPAKGTGHWHLVGKN